MSSFVSSRVEPGAVTSFASLSIRPETRSALARMGITDPTPIQSEAIPALLAGRDLIGQAKTGSGKTLAFAIPAIERIDPRVKTVQLLVLTPTRELAVQVAGVVEKLVQGTGITIALIYGGRAFGPQRSALARGAQIVVGTPGRVDDLYQQGALPLKDIRVLVLDEADEMLDRGFGPQVRRIVERTPRTRQTALFSATVPEWVHETAARHLIDPVHVSVDPNPGENLPIEHIAYDVPEGQKLNVLRVLLDQRGDGQVIVFGRTKHGVKKLAKQLEQAGYPVAALQGNLSQNARDRVMEEFRGGKLQILLATNVAARGLDITNIERVINYELPESSELLTHRVGRTGRMGRAGEAVTLLAPEDGAKWRQLERGLGVKIERRRWTGELPAPLPQPARQEPPRPRHEPRAPRPRPTPVPARVAPQREPAPLIAPPGSRPAWPPLPQVIADMPKKRNPEGARPPVAVRLVVGERSEREGHGGSRPSRPADSAPRRERPESPAPRGETRAPTDSSERPNRSRNRGGSTTEITCSACGQPAQIRFRPDPTRPVYCNDCFAALKGHGANPTPQTGSGNANHRAHQPGRRG